MPSSSHGRTPITIIRSNYRSRLIKHCCRIFLVEHLAFSAVFLPERDSGNQSVGEEYIAGLNLRNREYVCPLTLTIAENTPEMMCIRDFDTPVLARGQEMELHLIPAFHSLSFLYSSFLPSFLPEGEDEL